MKRLTTFFLFIFLFASSSKAYLYATDFYRLNQSSFRTVSYFSMGVGGNSFPIQSRREFVQSDTLFLRIAFNTTFPTGAFGAIQSDTIDQTLPSGNFNYINVSTGIIKYNDTNSNIIDTVWSMFDSTFSAVLSTSLLDFSETQLMMTETVLSLKNETDPVEEILLYSMNGQLIRREEDSELYIGDLHSGVYIVLGKTVSGVIAKRKWVN